MNNLHGVRIRPFLLDCKMSSPKQSSLKKFYMFLSTSFGNSQTDYNQKMYCVTISNFTTEFDEHEMNFTMSFPKIIFVLVIKA